MTLLAAITSACQDTLLNEPDTANGASGGIYRILMLTCITAKPSAVISCYEGFSADDTLVFDGFIKIPCMDFILSDCIFILPAGSIWIPSAFWAVFLNCSYWFKFNSADFTDFCLDTNHLQINYLFKVYIFTGYLSIRMSPKCNLWFDTGVLRFRKEGNSRQGSCVPQGFWRVDFLSLLQYNRLNSF